MREDHSSHIYIRVEDRIDPVAKGDIRLEQMIGIEAMVQTEIQDRIIKVVGPEETLEGIIVDSRERYRNKRYSNHDSRNRNRSGERTFIRNYSRDRSSSNDRSRSGSRVSTNRDRIRCYICREYDHFARDCPNSREERDLEQLQHMLNMEEQDSRNLFTHSSDKDRRSPLNL